MISTLCQGHSDDEQREFFDVTFQIWIENEYEMEIDLT